MFVWGEFVCAVYKRYQVSCFILHLIPLRQGFLLNLQLTWQLASPSNPPHSAVALSEYASAGNQTQVLMFMQQALLPSEPSP